MRNIVDETIPSSRSFVTRRARLDLPPTIGGAKQLLPSSMLLNRRNDMNFKQFYLGCLAHASYYVGSGTEAVVIDPQRDVQQYLDEAKANGQQIKYIIETHSHADFVSGHIELASKTGA